MFLSFFVISELQVSNKVLEIYTDGAARGNPGPASCAFILVMKGKITMKKGGFLGKATNNTAEYRAIIQGLSYIEDFRLKEVKVFSDSQLVIRQINGEYKVKKQHLKKLWNKVKALTEPYKNIEFNYLSRENNFIRICDLICNKILDEHEKQE